MRLHDLAATNRRRLLKVAATFALVSTVFVGCGPTTVQYRPWPTESSRKLKIEEIYDHGRAIAVSTSGPTRVAVGAWTVDDMLYLQVAAANQSGDSALFDPAGLNVWQLDASGGWIAATVLDADEHIADLTSTLRWRTALLAVAVGAAAVASSYSQQTKRTERQGQVAAVGVYGARAKSGVRSAEVTGASVAVAGYRESETVRSTTFDPAKGALVAGAGGAAVAIGHAQSADAIDQLSSALLRKHTLGPGDLVQGLVLVPVVAGVPISVGLILGDHVHRFWFTPDVREEQAQ